MDRMPANISRGGLSNAIHNRQAKPLTGIEVRRAVETHTLALTEKMLSEKAKLLSDQIMLLTDDLRDAMAKVLDKQTPLNQLHITYPRIGWNIKTRLHRSDESEALFVTADVELDLQYNVRRVFTFGDPTGSTVLHSLEEEKIPNNIPDRDRQLFGMPILVDVNKPDGTIAKVDLREIQSQPRRAARSVDVGRAAIGAQTVDLPTYDDQGVPSSVQVNVAPVGEGMEIVLPAELPEVTLDSLVATPPPPPPPPPSAPLPLPKSMAKVTRPDVQLKGKK